MTTKITLDDLKRRYACNRDTALFKEKFGTEVPFTEEGVAAVALDFDWAWGAAHLLTPRQQRFFKQKMLLSFRDLNRGRDPDKSRRKKAMAHAFFLAYTLPKE